MAGNITLEELQEQLRDLRDTTKFLDGMVDLLSKQIKLCESADDRAHEESEIFFEQIKKFHDFQNSTVDKVEKIEVRLITIEDHLASIDRALTELGDKVYPTYYKTFPEMIEVENTLERIAQTAGKEKPKA